MIVYPQLNTKKHVQLCPFLSMRILWRRPKACTCAPAVITKYQKRISGPLLDRIDIQIEVPRVDYEKLSGDRLGETSESIRKRVQTARDVQNQRFTNSTDLVCNADMRIGEVRQFCSLQPEYQSLMRAAMSQLQLSARASPLWDFDGAKTLQPLLKPKNRLFVFTNIPVGIAKISQVPSFTWRSPDSNAWCKAASSHAIRSWGDYLRFKINAPLLGYWLHL